MGITLSLKLTDTDKRKVDRFLQKQGLTPSELLRKALWRYINEVNLNQQENENQKVNLVDQKVNLSQQENAEEKVDHEVNHKIQISENYELMEYLKRDNEWLKDRIEHFEHNQDHILAKVAKPDAKAKKETPISLYRM